MRKEGTNMDQDFDYKKATREELIHYLVSNNRYTLFQLAEDTDEELRLLVAVYEEDLDPRWRWVRNVFLGILLGGVWIGFEFILKGFLIAGITWIASSIVVTQLIPAMLTYRTRINKYKKLKLNRKDYSLKS